MKSRSSMGMNASDATRKVILKKVDARTKEPLKGATFRLLDCDLKAHDFGVDESGNPISATKYLKTSDENGVFFVGSLPAGIYYLEETQAPEGFAKPTEGQYYKLTVQKTGEVVLADAPAAPDRLAAPDDSSDNNG